MKGMHTSRFHIQALFCFLLMMTGSFAQTIPDPPPVDPGSFFGMPDPAISPVDDNQQDNIPNAEPDNNENIPMAEPDKTPAFTIKSNIPSLQKASQDLVPAEQTQISILGYHDFSEIKPPTDMRIRTSVFRQQMLALKTAGIPVISMKEFIEWKAGERKLPPFCVMITIDDGWKSTYTDAFPILKEMEFPFTLFLYTNFLTGQGASLSLTQVREMIAYGAAVGSHSTSHQYSAAWNRAKRKGSQDYKDFLEREIKKSREWLVDNLGTTINTFCYPGGYHTPDMIEALPEFGYIGAFTVIPRKTYHNTSNWEIPRYMVLGNNPPTFARAVVADKKKPGQESGVMESKVGNIPAPSLPPPLQNVEPDANSVISNPLAHIAIEIPDIQNVVPNSIEMKVSGFGVVATKQIPETSYFQWKPSRPYRSGLVKIQVDWRVNPGNKKETAEWEFAVQPDSAILPPENIVK